MPPCLVWAVCIRARQAKPVPSFWGSCPSCISVLLTRILPRPQHHLTSRPATKPKVPPIPNFHAAVLSTPEVAAMRSEAFAHNIAEVDDEHTEAQEIADIVAAMGSAGCSGSGRGDWRETVYHYPHVMSAQVGWGWGAADGVLGMGE